MTGVDVIETTANGGKLEKRERQGSDPLPLSSTTVRLRVSVAELTCILASLDPTYKPHDQDHSAPSAQRVQA